MMDCSKDFIEENSEPEQHHAGTADGQDDETKQVDSKGRKTHKQPHVDVDVTITNKINLTLNYDKLIIYYTSISYMYTILLHTSSFILISIFIHVFSDFSVFFWLFVLTFLGESFAGSGLFMLHVYL
jgi:hypothetical protein